MPAKKKPTFEEQLAEVERMAARMESGEMTLEETLDSYGRGMETLRELEKQLSTAAQRLTEIRLAADGTPQEVEVTGEAAE